jgi:hypothetical protein
MQPKLIAFDFESTSLNFWEADFRVLSAAFAWFREDGSIGTRYLEGEDDIHEQIKIIADSEITLAAHNAAFEFGCGSRFPGGVLDRCLRVDTMRLTQVYDNGGSRTKLTGPMSLEDEMAILEGTLKVSSGLGLEASVSRILPKEFHNHKEPYYKWLRDNGVKKGQEGANLQQLPPEMLEAYNTMDAIVTLLLHKEITDRFAAEGFDWTFDHKLHFDAIKRIVAAKATGIKVNVPVLIGNESKLEHDINCTKVDFYSTYQQTISELEADRLALWIDQPKTARGKQARASQPMPEHIRFNPGSTQQLAELFIDKLGHKPVFFTKEAKARKDNPDRTPFVPKPSMRAAHLPSYGEGGEMLQTVKKRQLVAMQMAKLLDKSSKDGRWHVDLNPCGTKTGRYTGGGGLNIQALARKEKDLMGCLIPEDDYEFASVDLSAGEPTVTTHYSRDVNFRAINFDLVGQTPTYRSGLLLLDDPYLSFASISPLGGQAIADAWSSGLFEGWLTDADAVKGKLKKTRALHKTLFLALMYGQGPMGMVNFAADQGINLDFKTAKETHYQFWNVLFPGVRLLGERLEHQFEKQGFLYNELGFRMIPDRPGVALNFTIQSTVSGVMKVFETFLFELAPWASYLTTIHDEVCITYPIARREDTRHAVKLATKKLNEYLNWSVLIRTGFVTGASMYEAK